jgi:hypothetical protein
MTLRTIAIVDRFWQNAHKLEGDAFDRFVVDPYARSRIALWHLGFRLWASLWD